MEATRPNCIPPTSVFRTTLLGAGLLALGNDSLSGPGEWDSQTPFPFWRRWCCSMPCATFGYAAP